MREIVDSFEKNAMYVDNNSIFSKCYKQDVPNIMNVLMTNHNIKDVAFVEQRTFGKMIGFNRVIGVVYFIEKD